MPRAMYAVPRERTPVASFTTGSSPRCNIPSQATSLVGRETQSALACATLGNPDVHWLTMSGPPGVGKTRLALRVASLLYSSFPDGVCFVSLASITRPELVLSAIMRALLLKASSESLLDQMKQHLRNKRLLLVLDNFEQVTEAAAIVSELQMDCPNLKVLATSRTLLHLYGEHDFPVPTLEVPEPDAQVDLDALMQIESVALFVQRAQAARPDFRLTNANAAAVAEICNHLEGLPLAIELAAARVRLMPPQTILPRVEQRLQFLNGGALNLPSRQRTLRGAVEWSYDLLDLDEQALFRRLALFAGGATLEAITECQVPITKDEVPSTELSANYQRSMSRVPSGPRTIAGAPIRDPLDLVASLIDKSLLRQVEGAGDQPRYVMLETVREYALERLAESEEHAAMQRYALYYTELAERLNAELQGPQQPLYLNLLEQEHHNFRAALEWLNSIAEWEIRLAECPPASEIQNAETAVPNMCNGIPDSGTMALRLVVALRPFWQMRGHLREGRTRTMAALKSAGPNVDKEVRAQALYAAGRMALLQGDNEAAEPLSQESLELFRQLKHKLGMSCALVSLGNLAVRRADAKRAAEMYEEAFILRTEVGDISWIARSTMGLAYLAHFRGQYDRAVELHERSLALCREAGDKTATATALVQLGYEAAYLGQFERARDLLAEALDLFQEVGSPQGIAECLAVYGKIAHSEGLWERATTLFALAKNLFDAVGLPMEPPSHTDLSEYEKTVEELKGRLGTDLFAAVMSDARNLTPEQAISNMPSAPTTPPASAAPSIGGTEHREEQKTYGPQAPAVSVPVAPAPLVVLAEDSCRPQPQPAYLSSLTPREIEVLRLVACGLTNVEAADKLTVSRHTINMHLRSIYSKLEVTSRIGATRIAITQGLV